VVLSSPFHLRLTCCFFCSFCFQAADEFALFVIGKGAIAEGVKVKELAGRIRVAYEALPQKGYKCPKGQVRI
jgi:hypothetical protein